MNVLFVCHANVTRSVAAEYLLADATDETGSRLDVRSAGTHVFEGQPVSARTQRALDDALGVDADLSSHRARQLSIDDIEWADLVVAMEGSQVRLIRRMSPDVASRTATIGVLARELPIDARPAPVRVGAMSLETREIDDRDDVVDPAGGDDDTYAATMHELVALCASLAARIGAHGVPTMP